MASMAALQLLLYAAMLRAHHPTADGIRSTIRAGRKGQRDKDSLLTLRVEGQSVLTEEHDLRLQGRRLRQVVAGLLPEAHEGLIRARRGEPIPMCGLPGAGVDFRMVNGGEDGMPDSPGRKALLVAYYWPPAAGPASNAGSNSPNTSGNAAGI